MAIGANAYGKGGVRLVRITRGGDGDDLLDATVTVRLTGDLAAAYTDADNRRVLPTDTMRNTVYALAAQHPVRPVERFGMVLAGHLLGRGDHLDGATVELVVRPWERIGPGAFAEAGAWRRTATVAATRDGTTVTSGLTGLRVLKTGGSAFTGFLRDEYTTLADAEDRVLSTVVTATWSYATTDVDYDLTVERVRTTLLEVFADHASASVQHSVHVLGTAVLGRCPEVADITLAMPNVHHLRVDLAPFGLDDPDVLQPVDEPFGTIEGTVTRPT